MGLTPTPFQRPSAEYSQRYIPIILVTFRTKLDIL